MEVTAQVLLFDPNMKWNPKQTEVWSYINQASKDPDQMNAMNQYSLSVRQLQPITPRNYTLSELLNAYRKIYHATECMRYVFDNSSKSYQKIYSDILAIQLTTEIEMERYINMSEAWSFSGQPYQMLDISSSYFNCEFNLFNNKAVNLTKLTQSITYQKSSSASIVYLNGINPSPIGMIKNMAQINTLVPKEKNPTLYTFGVWIENFTFYSTVMSQYQTYLKTTKNLIIPKKQLFILFRNIIDLCPLREQPNAVYSNQTKLQFLRFFTNKTIALLAKNSQSWYTNGHVNFIKSKIMFGKSIILLAYAQGSFYANQIYSQLGYASTKYVSLMYIAPIVNKMADSSVKYFSSTNDLILSDLIASPGSDLNGKAPLPTNFPSINSSYFNHDLIAYTSSYNEAITGFIIQRINKTQIPKANYTESAIMVSTYWGTSPDVDVSVEEPSGQKVNRKDPNGADGYITMDDRDQFGPEIYMSYQYTNLSKGIFKFWINYFRGDANTYALVILSAETQHMVRRLLLSQAYGSEGELNPRYFVGKIKTKYGGYSQYGFSNFTKFQMMFQ